VPQILTIEKRLKKRDFRQPPPTTATFWVMVPTESRKIVPVFTDKNKAESVEGKRFSTLKVPQKSEIAAEKRKFRQPPPTTAIF